MKFYKDKLIPIHSIDLTKTSSHIINGIPRNFHSSSSCIIPFPRKKGEKNKKKKGKKEKKDKEEEEKAYILNIRHVNYTITNEGSYLDCDDHIITINQYLVLDKDFTILYEKTLNSPFENRRYIGIEDIKIFEKKNGDIAFIGTGFHKNDKIGIVLGDYNHPVSHDSHESSISLVGKEITPSFAKTDCEKNWVYFHYNHVDAIVYKWFPLTICLQKQKDEEEDSTNLELHILEVKKMPKIFKHTRGSTNGFSFNNEIWFIQHLVSYENPRHYYHMFSVFDEKMNLLRYSAPFKFEGEPIEYCLGLIVEEERIILSYSVWDRTTKISVFDKKYIESKNIGYNTNQ